MKNWFITFSILCVWISVAELEAQTKQIVSTKKFNVTGLARGNFYADRLNQSSEIIDSVSTPKLNSGHILSDLAFSIRPNKSMEVLAMARIRNDYGGFWGSGVTFDIRQMYVKGIIGGIVRYQLGDINDRMTKYTLWNQDQEFLQTTPTIFKQQFDVVNYDHFYNFNNSWRQQGAATEFALVFKKFIKEIQFHGVATRVKASDNTANNDRIFSGVNVQLVQSKFFSFGLNYAGLSDIDGTSKNKELFRNPVLTGNASFTWDNANWETFAQTEFGKSKTFILNNDIVPSKNGKFFELEGAIKQKKTGIRISGIVKRIDSEFLSPGAQTKRILFQQLPIAYNRIGNEQVIRQLTILDLMRESSLCNMQLQAYLMDFSPKYDNITPYGDATPNRQGSIIKSDWVSKNKNWVVKAEQLNLQEVRGEGTILPRKFNRTSASLSYTNDKISEKWAKRIHVGVSYRMDQTKRDGTEFYRGVDLSTNVMGVGTEIEVLKNLDVLFGYQEVKYSGFDYTARRDEYAFIYNFSEYQVDGNEKMVAGGLRYRFGEKSFLSAQWNKFDVSDKLIGTSNYKVNQFMLLYQMSF